MAGGEALQTTEFTTVSSAPAGDKPQLKVVKGLTLDRSRDAVRGADFIYTDVWYGLYENEMPKEARVRFGIEPGDTLLVLEEEELMKDLLHAHMGDGLEVTIGQENEDSHFKDSSIITATYHLNGELLGTIAVLGPTRMEYAKAMSLLEYMNANLTNIIKRFDW
mgnify:CR=1 FL=1